jgi:hypothetical protein
MLTSLNTGLLKKLLRLMSDWCAGEGLREAEANCLFEVERDLILQTSVKFS